METGWKSPFIKGECGCDIIMASRPALVSLHLGWLNYITLLWLISNPLKAVTLGTYIMAQIL